jgi:hypothetical protein
MDEVGSRLYSISAGFDIRSAEPLSFVISKLVDDRLCNVKERMTADDEMEGIWK